MSMSQRRGHLGPSRQTPPSLNSNVLIDISQGYPSPQYPSPGRATQQQPVVRGRGYTARHSMPPEPHERTNTTGRVGHSSLPPQHSRQNPSQSDVDNLQYRIRNMLSDDSPRQQTTVPPTRGRGRGLYHSPPTHTRQPPAYTGNRNGLTRDGPCQDITSYALNIVKSLEMPDDERREKEQFCQDLRNIVKRIRPTAKVELFGSFANTFTIANSDIDCCVTDDQYTSDQIQQSGLPETLQLELDLLGFETILLTQTRIPILKIFRPASLIPTLDGKTYKYPLHCDVGWQNRLALHNTRLLSTYSHIDPRLRQIVLFVKYWTKTRGIARPRYGTLCSYGYVLLIIYYLTHIVQPPVLPNLQNIPARGITKLEDIECEGCNISFSKDANGWKSLNMETIGQLIKGFFNFFAFEWHFKNNVISIRSVNGMITKESKGWTTLAESTGSQLQTIKSRYLIAIEDPFEVTHNVARTVNQTGRFEIRGEFIRAAKMLNVVNGRQQWLGDVCIERILPERRPRAPIGTETGDVGEMEDGHKQMEDIGVTVGSTVIKNVEEASTGTSVFRGDTRPVEKGRRKRRQRDVKAHADIAIVRTSPVESQRPTTSIPSPQTVEEPYYHARIGHITIDPLPPR